MPIITSRRTLFYRSEKAILIDEKLQEKLTSDPSLWETHWVEKMKQKNFASRKSFGEWLFVWENKKTAEVKLASDYTKKLV